MKSKIRRYKYRVYNSDTARSITVKSTSEANARAIGRKKGLDTKKGIVRAYRIK